MKIIDRLNEKLNYNQEILYLVLSLAVVFAMTARINLNNNFVVSRVFLLLTIFLFGIMAAYFIYKRDDNILHGYKVRDKIRSWFNR